VDHLNASPVWIRHGLRRARKDDMIEAVKYMHDKTLHGISPSYGMDVWEGEVWNSRQLDESINASPWRCILLIDGFAVDATKYLGEHVRLCLISLLQSLDNAHPTFLAWRCRLASQILGAEKGGVTHGAVLRCFMGFWGWTEQSFQSSQTKNAQF
jgi:hypothetical protein